MAVLAGFLLGILVLAAGTHQWAGVGLAVAALVLLLLLLPRAARQRSSRT
jgi:membrane protein implicated in regulation of membrane protease activity